MKTGSNLLSMLGWWVSGDLGPWTAYSRAIGDHVWFVKSPPLTPPTVWQQHQRNCFRIAAWSWQRLPQQERDNWREATRRDRTKITHYNLFVWWILHRADDSIRCLENKTGIRLLPLHWTEL